MLSLLFTICFATTSLGIPNHDPLARSSAAIRSAHPDVAQRVDGMQPIRNRAGAWYFPGTDLTHPAAQALIKDRIRARQDDAAIRVALVYTLESENRFEWNEIQTEVPSVRVAMLHGYKGINTPEAGTVLVAALQDDVATVRAEAARLAGYRNDVEGLVPPLMVGLTDPAEDVRRLAVRSLGWHQVQDAFEPVRALLEDSAPHVRVAAIRALAKIDIERARHMPTLSKLKTDENPSVQRAATRVLGP